MNRKEADPRGGGSYAAAASSAGEELQENLLVIYNALTSRQAKKTYFIATVLSCVSVIFYAVAAVSYYFFYQGYLPERITNIPIYLQYGFGANPYGVASLVDKNLREEQSYDISVSLTIPRSPENMERGNFMVGLYFLDDIAANEKSPMSDMFRPLFSASGDTAYDWMKLERDSAHYYYSSSSKTDEQVLPYQDGRQQQPLIAKSPRQFLATQKILYTSARPALIPYTHPLTALASRILFLGYHILFPRASEEVTLEVPMARLPAFSTRSSTDLPIPSNLLLEVQAGQSMRVYSASVTLTAHLRGLRWLMYRYRVSTFLVCTIAFWLVEMGMLISTWLLLALWFDAETPVEAMQEGAAVLGKVGSGIKEAAVKIKTEEEKVLAAEGGGASGFMARGLRAVRWAVTLGGGGQASHGNGGAAGQIGRKNSSDLELSDTERTFPTRTGNPPLHYKGKIKMEEGEQPVALKEWPGAEADDEDEDSGGGGVEEFLQQQQGQQEFHDSGIGTSMSDHPAGEGLRRRSSGSRKS